MKTVKITRNGVVTIPAHFRKALGLNEGDYVRAEMKDGAIIFKPVEIVDAEDAWFYTREWQKGEAEVDLERAEGKVAGPFDDVEDAIRELKK